MTREEMVQAAIHAQEKADAAKKGGYGGNKMPDITYLPLIQNKCQVFRMVGEIPALRKKPTDPLIVERSLIKGDSGYITVVWSDDPDWPLRKIMRKVAKYNYEKETKTKTYLNAGCELLHMITTNGSNNPKASGWAPQKYVLANVIDRMDNWCKENNHTKMIAWHKKEDEGKTYYTAGINKGMFDVIYKETCTYANKLYNEFDLVIRRYDSNTRPNEKTNYVIFDGSAEASKINVWSKKDGIDYNSFVVEAMELSASELKYGMYELDSIPFISEVTPAGVILSKLGKFIKAVDEKYDMEVYDELVAMKEKEVEIWNKKREEADTKGSHTGYSSNDDEEDADFDSTPEVPVVEEKMSAPTKEKVKAKAPAVSSFDVSTLDADLFVGIPHLSAKDKEMIVGFDEDSGELKFDSSLEMAKCGECQRAMPDAMSFCPYCAEDYSG
jgi:hypothetical protein